MKCTSNLFNRIKEKSINIIGIFFIIIVILAVFSLYIFLGSVIMKIFGVRYESILDLILFLGLFFIIDFPVSFIKSNLPKVLNKFEIISKSSSLILQCILSILITIIIVLLLNRIFIRLYFPIQAIIAFSIFIAVLDLCSERQ